MTAERPTDGPSVLNLLKRGSSFELVGPVDTMALMIDTRVPAHVLEEFVRAFARIRALTLGVDCRLKDLSVLRYFTELKRLSIYHQSTLSSLDGLEQAPRLDFLHLCAQPPLDLGPISDHPQLCELQLDVGRDVSGIQFAHLANLQVLGFAQAQFKDLEFLSSLKRLRAIGLTACRVGSWLALRKVADLEEVEIAGSYVDDLSVLASCRKLRRLDLSGDHRLKDLSFIAELGCLEELTLRRKGALDNLDFLRRLQKLRVLILTGIRPSRVNIEVFQALCNLRVLHIGKWVHGLEDRLRALLPRRCDIQYFNE